MLDAMRTKAPKWVIQIFFGLLVLSFAIWGIGDVFRTTPTGASIGTVAGRDVPLVEVDRELEGRIEQIRAQLGLPIDRQQAIQFGLLQQAVDNVVARHLIEAHAADLDLSIADSTLAAAVRDNPAFHTGNSFDRQRFDMVLRASGMNEERFIGGIRQDMLRDRLLGVLTASMHAPELLATRLAMYEGEKRVAEVLTVPDATMPAGEPDDAALQAFLDGHQQSWQAPEYRSGMVVVMRAEDLTGEIAIDDAAVAAEYQARIAEFTTPERRDVQQLLAQDEAAIREASTLVGSGQTLQQVAETLAGKGVTLAPLGEVIHGQLPENFDQAIFALPPDGVSEPVKTDFGWHLFKIAGITPAATVPLADKQAELRHELQLRQAIDQLPQLGNALEDAIAGGATLEEAAKQLGLVSVAVDGIDRSGQGKDGASRPDASLTQPMVTDLFDGVEGQVSPLEETPDGVFYVYRVDEVEPGRTRRLDEVKEQVATAWRADQQATAAKQLAETILGEAKAGASLESLALRHQGSVLRTTEPLGRNDPGTAQQLLPGAVRALFAAEPDSLVAEVQAVPGGSAVIRLARVVPADVPAGDALAERRRQLDDQLRTDLLQEYVAALRDRYPVHIDQQRLATLMQPNEQ